MSLVRVIGERQPAEELAKQLREHAYEVEILSAGTESSSAADLEITLEECSAEDVISKAVTIAQGRDTCLLVSSGVIAPSMAQEVPQNSASNIQQMLLCDTTVLEACSDELLGRQEMVSSPLAPHALDSSAPTVDLTRSAGDQTLVDTPPSLVFEELAKAETVSPPQTSSTNVADSITEMPQAESRSPESIPQSIASDWPIWQIVDLEVAPSESSAEPQSFKQTAGNCSKLLCNARQLVGRADSSLRMAFNNRRFLRIAMATATIATVGLLLTATVHRFSPLPERLVNGSSLASQPVPFQKAASKTNSPKGFHPASDNLPVPTQVPAPQVQTRSGTLLRTSHQLSRATSDDAGLIAKDVVIRYGSRSESRHIFSEPIHTGVKYYSDLTPATR